MLSVLRGLFVLAVAVGTVMGAVLLAGVINGTVCWLFQRPIAAEFGFVPLSWWVWVCIAVIGRTLLPSSTTTTHETTVVFPQRGF